ncbi:MAG: methylmalonyl Co-A mutase-associated GTPase MeaB [Crocinitomicaceae bacterium]|nr:methylmalonyl Co-A mutase-associated GTPase MeaB [Crocinitomicaceae bacterium]
MKEQYLNEWYKHRRSHKEGMDVATIFDGLMTGNRVEVSNAITLIESNRKVDRLKSKDLIARCLNYGGNTLRIGITGVPGVGKSTFIENLGVGLVQAGKKVAVLSIDPSSESSKGSILGDKTRMERLSILENAFIRPTASASNLGGVARNTKEAMIICEAAGYDVILVETVGVGQSEVTVNSMVDFFLLLMLPTAGDELQGIKRGIIELADAIVVTKADGELVETAQRAVTTYKNAFHFFVPKENGWQPKVMSVSNLDEEDGMRVWELIKEFHSMTLENGGFDKKRKDQRIHGWMNELKNVVFEHFIEGNKYALELIQKEVIENKMHIYDAVDLIVSSYFNQNKK